NFWGDSSRSRTYLSANQ
ncbi:Transcription-repair-coupling factor, partial [Haemophilus influenzae]